MDAEQQFQAAAQLYQSGDFPGAEARLEALSRSVPGNPNVLHLLSLARLHQDKPAAAADSLKALTDLVPGSAEAHGLLGCALRQSGRVNAAIRHLRKALEIAPDEANIHYNLGNAYRDDRQVPQAIIHYKRAVELNPDNLDAQFNLGQAYYNLREMAKAAEAFHAVTRKAPRDLEAQGLLARAAFHAKFFPLARTACEDALTLEPDDPDLLTLHAECATRLGDFPAAATSYDKLIAVRPGDTALLSKKAAVLHAMGDTDGALNLYRRMVEAEPDDAAGRAELGHLLERMNRLDDAWTTITPGLEAHPGDPALALIAARLERRAGGHNKALARLKALDANALEASPALGQIRFELGILYERLDRPGDAVENFAKSNAFFARDSQATETFRARSEEYLSRLKRAHASPGAGLSAGPTSADAAAPVFLVGFPRSITPLLDRVLDAHPAIQALEGQTPLSVVRGRLLTRGDGFPANLFDIPEADITALRTAYFDAVDRRIARDPATRLIDKLPLSILDAGLIHRLFPDARFVLALRHPCDICLDCFKQPFELNEGTVHFTHLDDTVRFYEEVMSLWQIQRDTLGLKVHEIRGEELGAAFEQTVHNLFEFLEVPGNDQVQAPVDTGDGKPSSDGDRGQAAGGWRTYEIHMAPHLQRLRPFIKAFGYADGAG